MNKKVLTMIVVLGIIITTKAQEVQFGIKGGVNFATLSGDTSGLDSRTAFSIGALSEIPISEVFSFQPEILYSSQGADAEGDDVKIDYLNIPIMGKYYVAKGTSLEFGPQIGLLLSANSEIDDEGDIKDEVKGFDFGLNFGVGYKLDNGLNFGLRYNLGLSNIYEEEDDFDFDDDYKVNNSVFQISVGYFF